MPNFAEDPELILSALPRLLLEIDVSASDDAELQTILGEVRAAQRCLDGLVIRIGVRANQLAAGGRSAPAEETMRANGSVGSHQARREAARSEAADRVPGLSLAISSGRASGEHADSIARHTTKLTEDQSHGFDFADLVSEAARLPPDTFDRLVRRRVAAAIADQGLGDANAKRAASEFRHWFDHESGMGKFCGSLDPERYEAMTNAIDQHAASLAASAGSEVTKSRKLAAQAMVELLLAAGGRDARSRLPSVAVLVDLETITNGPHDASLCQTEAGHDLTAHSIARLCCDAVIRRITLDRRGMPINVGRKYRTATDAQWAALKVSYSTCGWDGCSAPIGWCQAHHIREWENGGGTDLDNLIPLCSRHHHRVHEGGWRINLLPDRSLQIHRPDRAHHATVPRPQRC